MTHRRLIRMLSVIPAITTSIAATTRAASDADEVRAVVNSAYCNGAYNALDTAAMAQGFHPDFAILAADGDKLERRRFAWIG